MRSTYAAASIIVFMTAWNNYLWPLIVLQSNEKKTVTAGRLVARFRLLSRLWRVMVGTVLATLPTLFIFFLLQRQFVAGMLGSLNRGIGNVVLMIAFNRSAGSSTKGFRLARRNCAGHGRRPSRLPHNGRSSSPFPISTRQFYQRAFTYQKGCCAPIRSLQATRSRSSSTAPWRMRSSISTARKSARTRMAIRRFEARLTGKLRAGDNLLTVKIDGSENPGIPPFGGRIDYLTYAGIYRDVWLKVTAPVSIGSLKIETPDVLATKKSRPSAAISPIRSSCHLRHGHGDPSRRQGQSRRDRLAAPTATSVDARDRRSRAASRFGTSTVPALYEIRRAHARSRRSIASPAFRLSHRGIYRGRFSPQRQAR